jgi:hypothetical protein
VSAFGGGARTSGFLYVAPGAVIIAVLACVVGALLLAWKLPRFSRYQPVDEPEPESDEALAI